MLKPFINVIRACVISFAICAISSIVLEFARFPHSSLLQQFLIGAACSFIVVVVSTYAQYKVEFNKAFSNYISATHRLIFVLSLYQEKITLERLIEHAYKELEPKFEDFRKSEAEVIYFTKRAKQKFSNQNTMLHKIYIEFLKGQFDSHEKAVNAVFDIDKLICAIDTYLNCWPDCFEKEHIKMYKGWLVEEEQQQKS